MKRIFALVHSNIFFICLIFITLFTVFYPIFIKGQIPFSANLLASFFNPYAAEKFPGWDQGIPNKPTGIDDLRIFYPQRHFSIQTILIGQIPFWNPYNNSGNYLVGLSETAVFYPPFFIFFFLPQLFAWVILILIEPLLVGLGMYLFLKSILREKVPAAFGAIVFAFSGIVIVRSVEGLSVGHTLLWLPFALYGLETFIQKNKLRYLATTLATLCLSIFAGWFQFAFYIFAFSFIYAIFRFATKKFSIRSTVIFLPFILTPIITLFHIVPAFESLLTSPRGMQSIAQILELHLMPVTHIFTFIFPDLWGNPGAYTFFGKSEYKESILYIGTIPFIVSLLGLSQLKNKIVLFFTISALISLLLGLDTQITKFLLSLPIPIVSTFLPNRIFLITSFSFAVLSAFGFQTLQKSSPKISSIFAGIVTVSFIGAVNGYVFMSSGFIFLEKFGFLNGLKKSIVFLQVLNLTTSESQLHTISRIVLFPDILAILFALSILISLIFRKRIFLLGTIFILTFVGQFYFAQRYIPFSSPSFVFPKNPVFSFLQRYAGENRFISTQDAYISSNIPLFYNLYSPDGVGSMYISRYGELVKYMQSKGQSFTDIPRIETRIDPSADEIFFHENPYLLKFMQIDGIKYVVTLKKDNIVPNSDFSLVWQDNIWQSYKYKNSLPRFFLTSSFLVENNSQKQLKEIFDPKNSSKTIILEKDPKLVSGENTLGTVRLKLYSPNKIVFNVNSTSDALLFLSDTYSPNFRAFVDNKSVEVLRADYAFRAVVIPKGEHVVSMMYQDQKEIFAFIISFFSIGLLIAMVIGFAKAKIFPW